MLTEKIAKLINEQVNKEFYSAYLYLDMSNYFTQKGLLGFAHWFEVQAKEEQTHAMKFISYLHDNGSNVELLQIAKPKATFNDLKDPLVESSAHERLVTSSIYNILEVAQMERDYRTIEFLQWFVKEQGEEEKNADDLVAQFEIFGKDYHGLYLLNQQLGSRK